MREGLDKATKQRGERQGKVPYGYKRIGKSKNTRIVINDVEAEVIRIIYKERDNGKTLQAIAEFLNENGIKASRSPKWDHKKVQRIVSEISKEIYCGGMRNRWNELGVCWPRILPDEYQIDNFEEDIEEAESGEEYSPKVKKSLPPVTRPSSSISSNSSVSKRDYESELIPL